jgi:hypothetical protein
VAITLKDLRRRRCRLQTEALAGQSLDLRIDCRIGADGARELADPQPFEGTSNSLAIPVELESPSHELEAEGRRLRVDAVRPAHHQRHAVLLGPLDDNFEGAIDAGEDQLAGLLNLQREGGVENVRRRQAVVEPPPDRAELLGDRVDERGDVMLGAFLDLGDALRRRRGGPLPDLGGSLDRNDSHGSPAVERRELDLEQAGEPPLVRPDPGHGRARVPGNHRFDSRGRSGGCPG